jgi:hypothetical protein
MPPPCRHQPPHLPTPPYFDNGCRLCYLYHTDEAYRALWDNRPVPPSPFAVIRPLPCLHLGPVVLRARCVCHRQDIRQCGKGHGQVSQMGACETCTDYEADD